MALTLTIDCSYHQSHGEPRQFEISLDNLDDSQLTSKVKKALESQGWVVQLNGDNLDTYCSKKCAE